MNLESILYFELQSTTIYGSIIVQMFSLLSHQSCELSHISLSHIPVIVRVPVVNAFLLSGTVKCSSLICTFPASDLDSDSSLSFFSKLQNGPRNQKPGPRCTHLLLISHFIASSNISVYTNSCIFVAYEDSHVYSTLLILS
jgi:hypothetical protein